MPYLGSIKTRFEICKDENGELRYVRAIQGHSSDHVTQIDELRDDSLQVETIHLSRGSSTRPILHHGFMSGLVAGGKELQKEDK